MNDGLINELDKAIEKEKERFNELKEKRNELSRFMVMSSYLEKTIVDVTDRYEENKPIYEKIDEEITNKVFGPIVRLVIQPIYIGKYITNIGTINLRFHSKTLEKTLTIEL